MASWIATTLASAVEPADPDLIPEARRVVDYLVAMRGKRLVTGISSKGPATAVLQGTGREALMFATDAFGFSTKFDEKWHDVMGGAMNRCIYWSREKGGIVSLTFHWGMPTLPDGVFMAKHNPKQVDLARMLTPGTEEYGAFHNDLSVTADYPRKLADARVPVLWRPFHEIDLGACWWSDVHRPENSAGLYRQMFEYLVKTRGVHNLIWVFNSAQLTPLIENRAKTEPGLTLDDEAACRKRFYPGDAYVDIASIDSYCSRRLWGCAWQDSRQKAYALMEKVAPGKPLAIGEDFGLPNPINLRRERPPWLYAMSWSAESALIPPDWLRYTYNHEHMITLDKLTVFTGGNVAPNLRIERPSDHAARAGEIRLTGIATDRNGNLARVTIHALSEPRKNWYLRRDEIACERDGFPAAHLKMADAFPPASRLGQARVNSDGRWSFTRTNAATGFHNIVAVARDADGVEAYSQVVRVAVGLSDLAGGRPVTASSTSVDSRPTSAAVDEELNSHWIPEFGDKREHPEPQWLMVDLGAVQNVATVNLLWYAGGDAYILQVSTDAPTWRDVATVQARARPPGDAHLLRFDPTPARYVRLAFKHRVDSWMNYCLKDLSVY